MSFAIASGVLNAAVATNGTWTGSYPAGTTKGDFSGLVGLQHKITTGQKTYNAPADFTVAFTSAAIWTVTWLATNTLPAGQSFRLQLDIPGSVLDLKDVFGVSNVTLARIVDVRLGNPIATSAVNVRAAAAVAGAGLVTALLLGTLDVPRNLILTSSGNDSGITFAVLGKDMYGVVMNETITGANAGVAAGVKAFKSITSITASGAAAGTVSIGVGNVLGLPVYLPNAACILKEIIDNGTATAGTTVVGLSTATKPTATTADIRGTYVPNSAPDGAKSYNLFLALVDPSFLGNVQF